MTTPVSRSDLPLLWCVTDQLPFPPRNGITLPVFHYLEGLRGSHELRLILLHAADQPPQATELERNVQRFGPVVCVPLRRAPKWRRLLDEVRCREMFQHGWLTDRPSQPLAALAAPQALLVSPMSAVAKWRACAALPAQAGLVRLAAVNDCTTAEYYFRGQTQVGGGSQRLKGWLDRLRSHWIGRIERTLLAPYQTVLLQTERDRTLMAELVGPQTAAKVVLAPNGVAESCLSVQPIASHKLVFVGELSGEYAGIARWLVQDVWPALAVGQPQAALVLVGKGASVELRQLMAATPGVIHLDFVADLNDVYRDAMLAISPVFKGFGLINKTLEAMACGLPVVGGMAAFNGIAGFEPGRHGVVCQQRTTAEFVKALRQLMADPERRAQTGAAARALIAGQFKWATTQALLRRQLDPTQTVQ